MMNRERSQSVKVGIVAEVGRISGWMARPARYEAPGGVDHV